MMFGQNANSQSQSRRTVGTNESLNFGILQNPIVDFQSIGFAEHERKFDNTLNDISSHIGELFLIDSAKRSIEDRTNVADVRLS